MKKILFSFLLLIICGLSVVSQEIRELQFSNKSVRSILMALATEAEVTIIPDETVTGNTSYYFSAGSLDEGLNLFLKNNNLYSEIIGDVYYISRIKIQDKGNDNFDIDTKDTPISSIIDTIAEKLGLTILYDALPSETLTLHLEKRSIAQILQISLSKYPEYSVSNLDGYFQINYDPKSIASDPLNRLDVITRKSDEYSISLRQGRFRGILNDLIIKSGREIIFLGMNNPVIEDLFLKPRPFDELFSIILELGNSDAQRVGDIYYVFDIDKTDVLKKYSSSVYLPLTYISVNQLPNLLPSDLASSQLYRVDQNNNSIILYGSLEQIGPIQEFIEKLDQPAEGKKHHQFLLNYITADFVVNSLPSTFEHVSIVPYPSGKGFSAFIDEVLKVELDSFIEMLDKPESGIPVHLRYIKSEDLVTALPPSISEDDLIITTDPSLVFLKGNDEKQKYFLKQLEVLDKPRTQIRYELLVIQYQKGKGVEWDFNLANSILGPGDQTAYLGEIGNLLALNFDIISLFGYKFALQLNANINQSLAKIMADTTLNGLSGENLKFQNTNTYRYRETVIDSETGDEVPSSTTSVITSGLFINIDGWVSGDKMITMDISTTISKQGASSGSSSSSLPPTSEKVIETHVRTPAGEPVIISGLIQQDTTISTQKVPILGDIPLLGRLFRSEKETTEETELSVYIVPYIEEPGQNDDTLAEDLDRFYDQFGDIFRE